MAFYRSCKKCGETISFRQMPAGQWVAFEPGTDTPHKCKSRRKVRSSNDSHDDPSHPLKHKELNTSYIDYDLDSWKDLPKYPPNKNWIINNHYAKEILDAIGSNCRIEIVYSGGSTPMERRIIEPKEIFERAGKQYLSAYCCHRSDYRIFRFEKIMSFNMCEEKQSSPRSVISENLLSKSYTDYTNKTKELSVDNKYINPDTLIKTISWVLFLIFIGYMLFH